MKEFFAREYGADKVYGEWEALLKETAKKKGNTRIDTLISEQWDEVLVRQAALELFQRPEPYAQAVQDTAPASAIARMRSDYDELSRRYDALQKRHDALVRQIQQGNKRR